MTTITGSSHSTWGLVTTPTWYSVKFLTGRRMVALKRLTCRPLANKARLLQGLMKPSFNFSRLLPGETQGSWPPRRKTFIVRIPGKCRFALAVHHKLMWYYDIYMYIYINILYIYSICGLEWVKEDFEGLDSNIYYFPLTDISFCIYHTQVYHNLTLEDTCIYSDTVFVYIEDTFIKVHLPSIRW